MLPSIAEQIADFVERRNSRLHTTFPDEVYFATQNVYMGDYRFFDPIIDALLLEFENAD